MGIYSHPKGNIWALMVFLDGFPDFVSIGHINSGSSVWRFDLQRPALESLGDSLGGNLGCSDAVIIRQITTSGRTGWAHTDTDDPLFP